MQTDPNTQPHPCEAQPLEPMPSEPPKPGDRYSHDAEWRWAGSEWVPSTPCERDIIARLRAALHAKDAECEELKRQRREWLDDDLNARVMVSQEGEIAQLRAEVERLKAAGWRDAGEVRAWEGDLDDDCSLHVGPYHAHVECMDTGNWYASVWADGRDGDLYHSGEHGGNLESGRQAREICELVIRMALMQPLPAPSKEATVGEQIIDGLTQVRDCLKDGVPLDERFTVTERQAPPKEADDATP